MYTLKLSPFTMFLIKPCNNATGKDFANLLEACKTALVIPESGIQFLIRNQTRAQV